MELADIIPLHQVCTRCNTLKPITDFAKDRVARTGRRTRCKLCVNTTRTDRPFVDRKTVEYNRFVKRIARARDYDELFAVTREFLAINFSYQRRNLLMDHYSEKLREWWDPYIDMGSVPSGYGESRPTRPSRNVSYLFGRRAIGTLHEPRLDDMALTPIPVINHKKVTTHVA